MPDRELGEVLDSFGDIPIDIRVELDRLYLKLADVLVLLEGNIVTLTKPAGEPLDIYAGGVPLGSGEIMVLNENLGVRVTAHATSSRKVLMPQPWGGGPRDLDRFLKEAPVEFRNSSVLGTLLDGLVSVGVVVGRAWLPLEKVLKLVTGSFLELASTLHQPAEVVIDDRVLAYGQVVVVDGNYGVRLQSVAVHREPLAEASLRSFLTPQLAGTV
jgi:flagellar motor switch protein FliN